MSNDTEKFYNTYGKETSFEIFPKEATYKAPESDTPMGKISTASRIKKYLALILFVALIAVVILVGGIFMVGVFAFMLVSMILRAIFFKSNSTSGIFIIKK